LTLVLKAVRLVDWIVTSAAHWAYDEVKEDVAAGLFVPKR
jgi:hypothetical protein